MEPVAQAVGVTKRFAPEATPALDAVDLAVPAGGMTGLVGPDGAGKTTLIRILAGLIEPDGGRAEVFGGPATAADRSRIGYMPQRFGLYEDLTVAENMRLYADLRGLPAEERAGSFGKLLEFTRLQPFQDRLAGQLSGGMKQKLGLACALIREPRLLLLDEPGVGVDPVSRRELWDMVKALAGEGVGILWSTAYLDEAEKCDRVFLLSEGKLLKSGLPGDFLAPLKDRTIRVAADEPARKLLPLALALKGVIDGTVQGDAVRLLLAKDAKPDLSSLGQVRQEPTPPRFEDAFVDLLGGVGESESALAKSYRTIAHRGEAAIEAKALTRRFGDFTAARDISFAVKPGEIFGLLGPNGAGKSTTFKMLCGLLTPSSGTGAVAGNDLRHARAEARQSLGYMAQKFSLYADLSVRQNLDFFAGIYGLSGGERRAAIERVTDIFHLERYLKDNAGAMPLGYKQRLALACAVMHQPPVLFLDEPTSGVDPLVRREFWTHINGLVGKGVAVLVTTHFMDEAEYCDRVGLIYRAEQIAAGTPDELKASTRTDSMEAAFIALIEQADRQPAKAA
ncbi:ATP-binding cassette domain-containing protein [Sphingomonas sp. KRR8]|uniref:ATP-binding cassette domain-containing protein n=1 Tax=Sphingomonas sp. KRR8 TaxID=2942996 RepID=UPI002021BAD9|nr:ATP-binding cassette domain-containing protein [Sphingomonas sp. KRR8]URD60715.1 ATP-binding cassette domain-containing protein [Sphingomonas sp. KRR8]